jgi:hypothetical protein
MLQINQTNQTSNVSQVLKGENGTFLVSRAGVNYIVESQTGENQPIVAQLGDFSPLSGQQLSGDCSITKISDQVLQGLGEGQQKRSTGGHNS